VRVLIVYDTRSPNRNTEKVAESIGDALRGKGAEVQCMYVKNIVPSVVGDYDCVLVGSPTQAWRATASITKFLDSLRGCDFSGKLAAAFDTRVPWRFAGGAARGIEKRLGKLGFRIAAPCFAAYVAGKAPVLLDGELEKAKRFAEEIARASM
jgi:flavodoxin